MKKLIPAFVLIDFFVLNVYAVAKEGFGPLVRMVTAPTPTEAVLGTDLIIALSMVCVWMVRDAKTSRVNAWPHVVLTALTGSIGTLSYLLRRPHGSV